MSDDPRNKSAAGRGAAGAPAGDDATFANGKSVRPARDQLVSLVYAAPGRRAAARRAPLAGYEIIEEIGRGGMGVVFRARQRDLGREVAIKRIDGAHPAMRERFMAESRIGGRLDHPGIIPVYDLLVNDGGDIALVMKLVRGTSWKRVLHPEDDAARRGLDFHLDVLSSVANAVAFAHSRGLAHNDLKPGNVMVGEFDEVLVADWGLSLDIGEAPDPASPAHHRSTLETPSGTPAYWAPELALGDGNAIGPWTDVYLLGAILYEIATGRPPHRGGDLLSAVESAIRSDPPRFEPGTEAGLEAICRKAMAPSPGDRYPTVTAFQDALRAFRAHRESVEISRGASAALDRALAEAGASAAGGGARRARIYSDFADAAAGFRQALVLWADNREAAAGERRASLSLANLALENGDVGLAEVHASRLDPEDADGSALAARIEEQKAERRRAARTARRLRRGLSAAAAVIVLGLSVGVVTLRAAQQKTEAASALATARLADIRRLADVQELAETTREADELWPAEPRRVPAMEGWLDRARALAGRLDGSRAYLESLRRNAAEAPSGYRFAGAEEQWEHDTLAGLVAGLLALDTIAIPEMERRLALARSLARRTLEEPREAWQRAVASIADARECPAYHGLVISPQLGLVPLGRDPRSGLWEFAHLASGEAPVRDAAGALALTDATGVVLVLLPGGAFRMGARPPDKDHPSGSPGVDPIARSAEAPVHEVTLAPFFMGKYELTQQQWLRATGSNPSAYASGARVGGRVITPQNPVEQILWKDAKRTLGRLGLRLATEAQWEYAARAGTTTTYWTGSDKASLQGAANLADRYCKEHGGPLSWQFELGLDDGHEVHAPVGTYLPNPFGLHEMAGNVWEFVEDRYGGYDLPMNPGDGERKAPTDAPRVFRGGGFRSNAVHARSADRYSLYAQDYRGFDVGARAARALE